MKNYSEISSPAVEACGYAIYESGDKIYFINYGTHKFYTLRLIALLIGILFIVNSRIVMSENLVTGLLLAGAGLVLFDSVFVAHRLISRAKNKPVAERSVTMIADLSAKTLTDRNGNKLTDLEKVRFGQELQIISSASILRAYWPGGYSNVVVGSPFAFGLGDFKNYLQNRGLMKL